MLEVRHRHPAEFLVENNLSAAAMVIVAQYDGRVEFAAFEIL
ncbi:hypothetical protein V5F77_21995 [Xanthobacter sp. DSM 24535]